MIRWLSFVRYPDGVSRMEGDRWFLGTRVQELKQLEGICRYVTWRGEDDPGERRERPWHRLTEMGFRDWPSFERAMTGFPILSQPPWDDGEIEVESIFIGDKPEYDFLRDLLDPGDITTFGEEAQ